MNRASVFDVADWFLNKEPMSHKKLQKLCYYTKAWGKALLDVDLMPGYDFQAWVHGPVNRELYDKYKDYGWNDILLEHNINTAWLDNKTDNLLNAIWDTYGDKSANELEAKTHSELPWRESRGNIPEFENCDNVIPLDLMGKYYRSKYYANQGD